MSAPPYREVAATLRVTTERLARELARPTDIPPAWSAFEWDVARATAAMHGISALLARRLRWKGPARWEEFLREQVTQSQLRDARIGELLCQLDELARREEVGVVALKGAALRALEIYAVGERPMGDIDLYAPLEVFPAVARVLVALGYDEAFRNRRHVTYRNGPARAPNGFGEHIDNPIKIEVHGGVAEALPATLVDISARLVRSPLRHGVQGYRSRAALMAHLLLHTAGNIRQSGARLIQLQDIARLSMLMNAADWSELADAENAPSWWAYPALVLAAKYFEVHVPGELLEFLARRCSPRLVRSARRWSLTDVSWSNLRISAFPGIEWSRSTSEAARYAMSRLLPSRLVREEVSAAKRQDPHLASVSWYTQSYPVRAARWVFSQPPRVQTMTSVLAAFGDH